MWLCPHCRLPTETFDGAQPWSNNWQCPHCAEVVSHQDGIPCLAPALANTDEGFDPHFFEDLVKFEETSFWFVFRARLITILLEKFFPRSRSVLEIGCGNGSVLAAIKRQMPHLSLTGSELHPLGLSHARRRLGSDALLIQMDARNIPAKEQFDLIGAFDVIEHIPEDNLVLSEMRNALKPGGGVVITVPQHPWLWSPEDDAAHHQRRYARGELEAKLQHAGFRLLHSTSYNSLLLPLMLVSRQLKILQGRRGYTSEPLSEFRIPALVNRLLGAVMAVEVNLSARGMRWPIGGSRVVVAVRDS